MLKQLLQTQIKDYPLLDTKLDNLNYRLSLCGKYATKNFYCKKDPANEHLLKTVRSKFFCGIRYCNCPDCLVYRFKRQLETFNDISRFDGLRSLWHFSIGFKPISELDFKNNFSKHKKRFEYVLNRYFEKLRVQGIKIQAIRVLDFSFVTDGQVYLHYHFGALPVGGSKIRDILLIMKKSELGMINRMKIKTPFHMQSYGLASKGSVLSYLSIRASGMYKYDMTSNVNYKHIQGNLRGSIENHKYIFLKNVLTKEEYLNSFYNKAHFVCIGGLPRPPRHGSNITDGIPLECPIHGVLTRRDVRVEIIFEDLFTKYDPPPDFGKEFDEIMQVEIIRISTKQLFKISEENLSKIRSSMHGNFYPKGL